MPSEFRTNQAIIKDPLANLTLLPTVSFRSCIEVWRDLGRLHAKTNLPRSVMPTMCFTCKTDLPFPKKWICTLSRSVQYTSVETSSDHNAQWSPFPWMLTASTSEGYQSRPIHRGTLRWNLNSVPSNPSISFLQGPHIEGVFLSHVATKGWWAVERIIGLCRKDDDFALWLF